MHYWLIKSEPTTYSWSQFELDKTATWDGVRNYQARNNLKEMKKDDLCFFYHSNEGLCIVGVAKVVKEHFQDPTSDDKNWVAVEVVPLKKLKVPVKLQDIREDKRLVNMVLIKNSRLSVQPVSAKEAALIADLGNIKLP
jgi:predicted RNA-binding protein with PUA-like domain